MWPKSTASVISNQSFLFSLCKLLKTYYKLVTAKQFLENICLCLEQIAIHLDGALTILINPYVFDCLYYIMRHYIGSIDIFAAFVLIALGNHQKSNFLNYVCKLMLYCIHYF